MSETALLFVYGSLRTGQFANDLLEGCPSLGRATTAPRYTLVALGSYPGLLEQGTTAVIGELFQVAHRRLVVLDRYEGSMYRRAWVTLADGRDVQGYLLLSREDMDSLPKVPSGDWLDRRGEEKP